MSKEELIEFLRQNLRLRVRDEGVIANPYNNGTSICFSLELGEETISEDWLTLSHGNDYD